MNGLCALFLSVVAFLPLQTEVVGRGSKKQDTDWDRLVVTFRKFSLLPITTGEAQQLTWYSDASCPVVPIHTHGPHRPTHRSTRRPTRRSTRRPTHRHTHGPHPPTHRHYQPLKIFPGNRYVLGTDETTRVLYSADGRVAGIQATITAPTTGGPQPVVPPWAVRDDYGNLLFTAYFKDPSKVCHQHKCNDDIIGDRLWILISDYRQSRKYIKVPLERKDLKGTKWVEGRCFTGMGVHYWYDISRDMDCKKFYPVFLLYSKQDGRLKAFGWSFGTYLDGPRWEHPSGNQIRFFFQPQTLPKCLLTMQNISTQHVYLSDPRKLVCN